MNEKFFNRFRIPSARMRNWNYGWNAPYFITICTQKRTCYFGKIIDGKMELSAIGKIAQQYWTEIPIHFPFVHLGAFVIMPNHVHGIVIIDKQDDYDDCRDVACNVCTESSSESSESSSESSESSESSSESLKSSESLESSSTQSPHTEKSKNKLMADISPKIYSLSTIIRSYKSAVSKQIHHLGYNFAWQTRFHDHIILNHESYVRIDQYIENNPMKWFDDKFFE